MPVHGAVLTLAPNADVAVLAPVRHLTLGEPTGQRIPVMVDTPDRAADRTVWRHLERLPGVAHIELVFTDFSDLKEVTS